MNSSFIKSINDIYKSLADDLSKMIYENNSLYALTGNVNFIKNTINSQSACTINLRIFGKFRHISCP